MKFGTAERHVGQLGPHPSVHKGGYGPEMSNKLQFPRMGESLDQFLQLLGTFMRPTTPHKCFKFDVIRFTDYRVIADKPRVGQSFTSNFSVHPVGKTDKATGKLVELTIVEIVYNFLSTPST